MKYVAVNELESWRSRALVLVVLFSLYLGLYPLAPWVMPVESLHDVMWHNARYRVFGFDVVQNLLFFLPLGFIAAAYYHKTTGRYSVIKCIVLGLSLSILIEILQGFIPMRVPSYLDLVLNALSTLMGVALFYCLARHFVSQEYSFVQKQTGLLLLLSIAWITLPCVPTIQLAHWLSLQFVWQEPTALHAAQGAITLLLGYAFLRHTDKRLPVACVCFVLIEVMTLACLCATQSDIDLSILIVRSLGWIMAIIVCLHEKNT